MKFTLELTEDQIVVIDKALQALPLGQVVTTWLAIKQQVEEQSKKELKKI